LDNEKQWEIYRKMLLIRTIEKAHKTGPCKGKGTQQLADRKNKIPGLAARLGSVFSMAVGTALAAKMRDMDQVAFF